MEKLRAAFDPESFREQGHRVVDMFADLLAASMRREGSVLPWTPPAEELAHWERRMANPGTMQPAEFIREFAERSIKLHHPRYVGHQVCAPAPAAALAGLASELLNNGMSVFEMGPAAAALERWLVRTTCTTIGFTEGEGFLTSGGTLATLTALIAAREVHGGDAVMASEEAHYCVARAARVMGWGADGFLPVPTDSRFKMRCDMLDELFDAAVARGRRPTALVASACSTSTGSYDDLHAVAEFCKRRGLWLHVDGAHGAAVAFCPELRDKIAGIEMADSAILDFHKLLLAPALSTAVLFREPSSSWAAFHQRAQYLFAEDDVDTWRDAGRRTMECTKFAMAAKTAVLWQAYGPELFAEYLRVIHSLATGFAQQIRSRSGFEVAVEPESNIVCFRFRPAALTDVQADTLNAQIRRQLIEAGEFYLVQTTLRGRIWLRTTLMNPFTSEGDFDALLDRIQQLAAAKP